MKASNPTSLIYSHHFQPEAGDSLFLQYVGNIFPQLHDGRTQEEEEEDEDEDEEECSTKPLKNQTTFLNMNISK
jgi:hypothetical protein